MSDEELLRSAEVTLEASGPGRRALKSFVRGVVLHPGGWKRRMASWAARISFDQAGFEGVVIVDAVRGSRFTDAHGQLPWPKASFLAVTEAQWAGASEPRAELVFDMAESELIHLDNSGGMSESSEAAAFYDGRCAEKPDGCHVEGTRVATFCNDARRTHCIEPLEAEFRTRVRPLLLEHKVPGVILAKRGGDIRWLTDGKEVLSFVGGTLRHAMDLRMFVLITGMKIPPPAYENQRWADRFHGRYFRFDDPAHPVTPGTCAGFVVETDGTITKVCLPKVVCHPPTAAQLKELGLAATEAPRQVCESGDGGFGWTEGTGSCLCSVFFRRGEGTAGSCTPCTQMLPPTPKPDAPTPAQ